jgi:hypothetical protein
LDLKKKSKKKKKKFRKTSKNGIAKGLKGNGNAGRKNEAEQTNSLEIQSILRLFPWPHNTSP